MEHLYNQPQEAAPVVPKTQQRPQVAAFLDPEDWDVMDRMSQALGQKRAEILRQLVHQGIVALQAAAAAEDAGADLAGVNAAVIEAIGRANVRNDEAVMLHFLDLIEDYLRMVATRRPKDAILLAGGAATALRGWADQQAEAIGLTVEHVEETASLTQRLAAHEALAERLTTSEEG